LKRAWKETPIKWYPIPILLGAIVLIGVQARRLYNADQSGKGKIVDGEGKVVTMSGPWAVSKPRIQSSDQTGDCELTLTTLICTDRSTSSLRFL
jgi:hypothetical protein